MSNSSTELTSFALSQRLYQAGIIALTRYFYVIDSTAPSGTAPESVAFAQPQIMAAQKGVCFIPAYDEATLVGLLEKCMPGPDWLFEMLDQKLDIQIEHFWDVFSFKEAFTIEVVGELLLESKRLFNHPDPPSTDHPS